MIWTYLPPTCSLDLVAVVHVPVILFMKKADTDRGLSTYVVYRYHSIAFEVKLARAGSRGRRLCALRLASEFHSETTWQFFAFSHSGYLDLLRRVASVLRQIVLRRLRSRLIVLEADTCAERDDVFSLPCIL